jgi:hypothetical protein
MLIGKIDLAPAVKRSRCFRFLAVVKYQNYSVTLFTGWVTPLHFAWGELDHIDELVWLSIQTVLRVGK